MSPSRQTDQQHGAQRAAQFENLTEPQRLAVLRKLLGSNRATRSDEGLVVWGPTGGFVPSPSTHKALVAFSKASADEINGAIAEALQAPAEEPEDDEEDEEEEAEEPSSRPKKSTKRREQKPERKRPRISRETEEIFSSYLSIGDEGFGRYMGRFVVTTQALGLIPREWFSASDRAVIWSLSMFLDPNTGRGTVSQTAIALRAGCGRQATSGAIKRARKLGILTAAGPSRRPRRYRLLRPSKWPAKLLDAMRGRLEEECRAIRAAGEDA